MMLPTLLVVGPVTTKLTTEDPTSTLQTAQVAGAQRGDCDTSVRRGKGSNQLPPSNCELVGDELDPLPSLQRSTAHCTS